MYHEKWILWQKKKYFSLSFALISICEKKWNDCINLGTIEKMHILLLRGDPFQLLKWQMYR